MLSVAVGLVLCCFPPSVRWFSPPLIQGADGPAARFLHVVRVPVVPAWSRRPFRLFSVAFACVSFVVRRFSVFYVVSHVLHNFTLSFC